MRPVPAHFPRTAHVAAATFLALATAAVAVQPTPAHAQARGMDCRAATGGRMTCTTSDDALVEDLGARAHRQAESGRQAEADRAVQRRQARLARATLRAVREGRCDDAQALAQKLGHAALAEAAARECIPASPT